MIPLMFIIVHTFRTVCGSVLVLEHPRGGRVIIRGLLWNQTSANLSNSAYNKTNKRTHKFLIPGTNYLSMAKRFMEARVDASLDAVFISVYPADGIIHIFGHHLK